MATSPNSATHSKTTTVPPDEELKAPVWKGRRADDPSLNPAVASLMKSLTRR